MDWVMFVIGFVAGFFAAIVLLIFYGRKQIRDAFKNMKE